MSSEILPNPYPHGEAMQQLCDGELRRPGEAYAQYVQNREEQGLSGPNVYFTTTITSGGFFRDDSLDFSDAMSSNNLLSRGLSEAVIQTLDIDPSTVVLPSELGKVAGWSQADFLVYWIHVIYGSEQHAAVELDRHFQTDHYQNLSGIMSDSSFSYAMRRQAYAELIKYTETTLMNGDHSPGIYDRPLLVPLVDDELSLGCFGERIWPSRWRNPLLFRLGGFSKLNSTGHSELLNPLENWTVAPQYPVKLDEVANALSIEISQLVRSAQLLGATVMGSSYNSAQAQLWANYYCDVLVA